MLGFSQKAPGAGASEDRLALSKLLSKFAEQFSGTDIEDAGIRGFYSKRFWAFSDSIVVRWHEGSKAQRAMSKFDADLEQLTSIAVAQASIIHSHNQLVRGDVAQSWHLEEGKSVLGAALVKAVKLAKSVKMRRREV